MSPYQLRAAGGAAVDCTGGCRIKADSLDALPVNGGAELLALGDELARIDEREVKDRGNGVLRGYRRAKYPKCWASRARRLIATGPPPGSGCTAR